MTDDLFYLDALLLFLCILYVTWPSLSPSLFLPSAAKENDHNLNSSQASQWLINSRLNIFNSWPNFGASHPPPQDRPVMENVASHPECRLKLTLFTIWSSFLLQCHNTAIADMREGHDQDLNETRRTETSGRGRGRATPTQGITKC